MHLSPLLSLGFHPITLCFSSMDSLTDLAFPARQLFLSPSAFPAWILSFSTMNPAYSARIFHLLFLLSQQNIFTLPLLSRQGSFILILVVLTSCFLFSPSRLHFCFPSMNSLIFYNESCFPGRNFPSLILAFPAEYFDFLFPRNFQP